MLTFTRSQAVVLAIAMLFAVACFAVRFPALGQDSDSSRTKLVSLLKERRDVLQTHVEVVEALFKIAKSTPEAVIAARDALLDAEYDMATSKDQRIEVLKRKVVIAKELESIMQQRKGDAKVTEAEVLMARAHRLEADIKLLREQE
jgi:hypothetical protein